MKSSIFFRSITVLDHSYIDREGRIHGRSYDVSVTVTGNVTEDENVVLDFSAGKKQMKAIIDDNNYGFDHKLLLYKTSNFNITAFSQKRYNVKTPYVDLILPMDAVQLIGSDIRIIEHALKEDMEKLLEEKLPAFKFEVSLRQYGVSESTTYFRYSHGLRKSTSFGCKNLGHGHTSFVEVIDQYNDNNTTLERAIAGLFNDKVLISMENVLSCNTKENYIEIGYDCERGTMYAIYTDTPYLVLETETTIEHMTAFAAKVYKNELKGLTLRISEGLSKGCEIKC